MLMFKKIRERGFTDKLYFLNLALSWLFIIICIVMTALSRTLGITDLSLVSVGIPAVFAELGVHTGFIVWKAKTENINKYRINPDTYTTGEIPIVKEEEQDDNNLICDDADPGCGSDSFVDRGDQEGLRKFRERLQRKHNRFN